MIRRLSEMARKPISADTQKVILLKSRRRCCLCFWLESRDEVLKGQFAHLDNDPENNAEDNIAFLCFNHHDEYDGKTRIAKGLREKEVRHWRDELYREMEYRFHTLKKRGFELSIAQFLWLGPNDEFKARLSLMNTGELAVRSPTVSICLPKNVGGELPERHQTLEAGPFGVIGSVPIFEPWKAYEKTLDLFEPGGRVVIKELGGINPVLMPGHSFDFEALVFRLTDYPEGSSIELEYRVDAEGITPFRGKLVSRVPTLQMLSEESGRTAEPRASGGRKPHNARFRR
jgi:hypothetical protein